LLIAPGLVDFGVFAIDKPAFHFGGITRAALCPDQSPPLDHPARVRFAASSGKPDFWVHPARSATGRLEGTQLAEIALMRDAGARASHRAAVDRRQRRDAPAAAVRGDARLVVVTHPRTPASPAAPRHSERDGHPPRRCRARPPKPRRSPVARDIALGRDDRRPGCTCARFTTRPRSISSAPPRRAEWR
jgi:dihydroorotase-like cyclic amidohydrolase